MDLGSGAGHLVLYAPLLDDETYAKYEPYVLQSAAEEGPEAAAAAKSDLAAAETAAARTRSKK